MFAAKHILEMHQSTVEIQSSVGLGATVIVKFPVPAVEVAFNSLEDELMEESTGALPVDR